MPEWLLPHNIPPIPLPTESKPNKPDLIMLWEDEMLSKCLRSHLHPEEDGYQELVHKTPTTTKEKKLKILEICYTSLPKITQREKEKKVKYAPMLERLTESCRIQPRTTHHSLGTS
jgi:hypothetical protein